MPKMVKLAANPAFKPSDETEKAAWDFAKKKGPVDCDYVTAMENIHNSGGALMIVPEAPAAAPAAPPRRLEDMELEELKIMMLNLGIKTEKQMKKSDVVRLVRSRMDQVEIIDDAE